MKVGIVHAPALADALHQAGVDVIYGEDARASALAVKAAIDEGEQVAVALFSTSSTAAMLRAWSASLAGKATVVPISEAGNTFELASLLGVSLGGLDLDYDAEGSLLAFPAAHNEPEPQSAALPQWAPVQTSEPASPSPNVPPSWAPVAQPAPTQQPTVVFDTATTQPLPTSAPPAQALPPSVPWGSGPRPIRSEKTLSFGFDLSQTMLILRGKGGVGASTLALALAQQAADAGRARPLVVELDGGGASITHQLGAGGLSTIADIASGAQPHQAISTPADIRAAGGVKVDYSIAPAADESQNPPSANDVEQVLQLAASRSGLIVVDAPPLRPGSTSVAGQVCTAALKAGAHALVLLDGSRAGLAGALELAGWARGFAPHRVHVALNLAPQMAMPDVGELQQRFAPTHVLGVWPYDASVAINAAKGQGSATTNAAAAAVLAVMA